jgi:glutaconate CoA-transferase subunit B
VSGVSARHVDAADVMTVTIARRIADGEVVFVGNTSPLPLAAVYLAKRLHAANLVFVNVSGSVDPRPEHLPVSTTSAAELMTGTASIFSSLDFYDLFARRGIDLAFLSAAQIDAQGRLNNSLLGSPEQPRVKFPGGGGAGFIMPLARRVIVWRTRHDRRAFVERCDFVTASGNLESIVTPFCVLRAATSGFLEVESVHAFTSVEEVQERTGFALRVRPEGPATTPPPTDEELRVLNEIDPYGSRFAYFD